MKEDSNVTMNPVQPSISWILKSPHRFLAFGFGSGLIRPAPGTWGTLLALLLWFPLSLLLQSDWLMGGFLAGCFLYGIYCSQKACDDLGVDDHGGIVWDEWVAFWLVLFITTPVPWPIKYFEKQFQNGFGVMFDDIIAALYVLFTVAVVIRLMEVILV